MIVRCKKRKLGDGGIVDGCGWQGEVKQLDYRVHNLGCCPSCGSVRLRTIGDTKMKPGYEPKYLLGEMGQICEEAGEVLKHFGKILRFGLENVYDDPNHIVKSGESNRTAFYRELDDLEACIKRIKARHTANPSEALGPIPDAQVTPYVKLAEAAQEYLEVLSDAEIALRVAGKDQEVPGVRRRGRLREAYTKLNALVGVALGNTQV